METDLWVVLQAAALVTAGFGVWILGRACWDYAGVPAVRDAYLELVDARLQELGWTSAPGGEGFARAARAVRSVRSARSVRSVRSGLSGRSVLLDRSVSPIRRRDAEFLRRTRRALLSRPHESERAASQKALLHLINRPALSPAGRIPAQDLLPEVAETVAAATTLQELARTERMQGSAVRRLLRRDVPRRFRAVFLPGMARYLDFVGRGSSLGLALGVLLGGGLTGNADLVGALTAGCGVVGAIFFTLTVIRCESRSWPAGESGVWLRLARRYPQAYFLLRLVLATVVVLFALHLMQG